jgi:predicted Zn-dependent peptidase
MRPRIDEALFERLRSSALERLESTEANVDRRLRLLERTAANPNLPGLTQELDASSLRALTPTRLQAQAQRCFAPDNVALAIAGRLDEAEVLRLTGPLSRWKTAPVPPRFVAHTPATPRQVWLAPLPDASRVTVTLVGRGMPPGTLDRATAETLMAMLRARLSTELRELIGAAYTVEAAAEVGPGSGAAWVRFTTRREIAWEAALAAARLFERWFVRWPFDTQSVQKVTNQLLRLDARTSAWQHAFGAARRSLVDGRRDEEQWAAQLAAVEWQNVSAVFNAFFQPSTLQIVVAGEFDPTQPWGELGAVKAAPEPSR